MLSLSLWDCPLLHELPMTISVTCQTRILRVPAPVSRKVRSASRRSLRRRSLHERAARKRAGRAGRVGGVPAPDDDVHRRRRPRSEDPKRSSDGDCRWRVGGHSWRRSARFPCAATCRLYRARFLIETATLRRPGSVFRWVTAVHSLLRTFAAARVHDVCAVSPDNHGNNQCWRRAAGASASR